MDAPFELEGEPWAEIHFALTKRDLGRFYASRYWRQLPFYTALFPILLLLIPFIVISVDEGIKTAAPDIARFILTPLGPLLLLIGPLFTAFMSVIVPWCISWRIRRGDEILSPVTLLVFDVGFKLIGPRGIAAYPWADVIRLRRSKTLIEIWTSRMLARLVPASAIGDRAMADEFFVRCQTLWQTAKAKGTH